jgi:hypothetical protein
VGLDGGDEAGAVFGGFYGADAGDFEEGVDVVGAVEGHVVQGFVVEHNICGDGLFAGDLGAEGFEGVEQGAGGVGECVEG